MDVGGETAARWRGALAVSRPYDGAAVPHRTAVGGRRRVRAAVGSRPRGGVVVPRRLDGGGHRHVGVLVVRVGAG